MKGYHKIKAETLMEWRSTAHRIRRDNSPEVIHIIDLLCAISEYHSRNPVIRVLAREFRTCLAAPRVPQGEEKQP